MTAHILLVLVLNGLELYFCLPCVPMYARHGETSTFIFMSDMTLHSRACYTSFRDNTLSVCLPIKVVVNVYTTICSYPHICISFISSFR